MRPSSLSPGQLPSKNPKTLLHFCHYLVSAIASFFRRCCRVYKIDQRFPPATTPMRFATTLATQMNKFAIGDSNRKICLFDSCVRYPLHPGHPKVVPPPPPHKLLTIPLTAVQFKVWHCENVKIDFISKTWQLNFTYFSPCFQNWWSCVHFCESREEKKTSLCTTLWISET